MKIIRADVLGFCMGVRRAVDTVNNILAEKNGKKVFTVGPLIHNPIVLKKMQEQGVRILDDTNLDAADKDSIAVIRAHGVPPAVCNTLKANGCKVIDATCPRVKVNQKRAEEYSSKGYLVILTGDKNHGEVIGIAGFAGKDFLLIQTVQDAENSFKDSQHIPQKAVLLSQTTFSPSDFLKIADILKKKLPSLEIFNTICPATRERQDSLTRLCRECDGIIIIGGKNSANTQRLFQNAQILCSHAAMIEIPDEIPSEFFLMKTVGITAGASTPDEVIDAVEKTLLQHY